MQITQTGQHLPNDHFCWLSWDANGAKT